LAAQKIEQLLVAQTPDCRDRQHLRNFHTILILSSAEASLPC
jgi:hypothetical protein